MKLYISQPFRRESGPILVCDSDHNDIAEFFHNEHATVAQSYETALRLAAELVAAHQDKEHLDGCPSGDFGPCDCPPSRS